MRMLVWGTGRIAEKVINGIDENQIVAYIETKKSKDQYRGKTVYSASDIPDNYDVILIANASGSNIYDYCLNSGIRTDRLCFLKPIKQRIDIENNLKLARQILKPGWYDRVCSEFGIMEKDWVEEDAKLYSLLNTHQTMQIKEEYNWKIYADKFESAGQIHDYFWQDLWAARKIYKNSPSKHYDIGSRIDGFVAHLLAFMDNVNLIDIRPLEREVDGLEFACADATNLNSFDDDSIESLSALCSLEHFGLGRYGDKVDPDACYKCFDAIGRKVKGGGDIYLSVPVGFEHIEFNAHRVFYASTIINAFPQCELIEYSCTNNGYIEYNVDVHQYDDYETIGGICGLFHFRKKQAENDRTKVNPYNEPIN